VFTSLGFESECEHNEAVRNEGERESSECVRLNLQPTQLKTELSYNRSVPV